MQYEKFCPSPLEVKLVEELARLVPQLESHMDGMKISKLSKITHYDHPELVLTFTDADGDLHEVTLRVIHTPHEDLIAQGVIKKNEPQ
ncbi:MAG: hypothetical protein D6730_02100 [Bacteroidetes bacterium]|nr:MAG: hypothetical protein D6730_02100 [Bacteroidota bacterium]